MSSRRSGIADRRYFIATMIGLRIVFLSARDASSSARIARTRCEDLHPG